MQQFWKRTIPTICRFYISWERKIVENSEIHNIPIFVDLKAEELKIEVWKSRSSKILKDWTTRTNLKIQKFDNSIVPRCCSRQKYLNPTISFYASQVLDINMRDSLNNTSLRRLTGFSPFFRMALMSRG